VNRVFFVCACGWVLSTLVLVVPARAQSTPAFGLRVGASRGPDEPYLGLQTELGTILGSARFAPSLDVGFGDGSNTTVLNGDLRWYLLPLPETGLRIYGAAGPTLSFSPDTEVGLTLTAGLHIPMKNGRRYNVEVRFGFGDTPDLKLGAGVLFRL
jgi:hypothetical protein